MSEVTKAIIPVAGRGTRFLPLSKVVPKEMFPLGDKPLIHHAVAEAKEAGAKEIIFVTNTAKKFIADYFKRAPQLEKVLEERKEGKLLEDLRSVDTLLDGITISFVSELKPLGDGHAVLQAKRLVGDNPCFVLYPDDMMVAARPVLGQLERAFRTSQRSVIGLARVPEERVSSYGVVDGEKITNRVYKIKSIVEKPKESPPSNLVITGRSVLTPEVFAALKKAKPNKKGEISLTETFAALVNDGQVIYGNEFEGRWLECGTKEEWMKSVVAFALQDPILGKEVRAFLKEEKLL